MATLRSRTVKAAGGDYATIFLWEAGEQADLAVTDEIREALVDDVQETATISIAGWNTTATQYAVVKTTTLGRHSGYWDAAKQTITVANSTGLTSTENFLRLEGLQVHVTGATINLSVVSFLGLSAGTTDFWIDSCIIRLTNTSATGAFGLRFNDTDIVAKVWNTQSIGAHIGFAFACSSVAAYNNLAIDCGVAGFSRTSGTVTAKGNVASGCTDGYSGTFGASSTNNCSDLAADAPGSSAFNSQSFTFENAGALDYRPAAGDTGMRGHGVDLSADATIPFSIDCAGFTRSAWDAGPNEYQTPGGGGSANGAAAYHYRHMMGAY